MENGRLVPGSALGLDERAHGLDRVKAYHDVAARYVDTLLQYISREHHVGQPCIESVAN
jgi:hypothetical protein